MSGGLVLSRQIGKSIMIGNDIKITVLGINGKQTRLSFCAPKEIKIHRLEVYEKIKQEKKQEKQEKQEQIDKAANFSDKEVTDES